MVENGGCLGYSGRTSYGGFLFGIESHKPRQSRVWVFKLVSCVLGSFIATANHGPNDIRLCSEFHTFNGLTQKLPCFWITSDLWVQQEKIVVCALSCHAFFIS